jgi:hypothetical protein
MEFNAGDTALVLERHAKPGGGYEVFAICAGNFRRDCRDSHASRGPKLSVVCVLQRQWRRRHELWVHDISTVLGHRERDRRILQPEYAIPAAARPPLIASTLSSIPLKAFARPGHGRSRPLASLPRRGHAEHSRPASWARHQVFRDTVVRLAH